MLPGTPKIVKMTLGGTSTHTVPLKFIGGLSALIVTAELVQSVLVGGNNLTFPIDLDLSVLVWYTVLRLSLG